MKTLKDIILEATSEVNPLPRRTKNFIAKHTVQKIDYPVDAENQFTAKSIGKDKTKGASYHNGEDSVVYEEVEQIDELSKKTLGSYINKATMRIADKSQHAGEIEGRGDSNITPAARSTLAKLNRKTAKSITGISRATNRLTREEVEQIDELSKQTMASYAKKASNYDNQSSAPMLAAKAEGEWHKKDFPATYKAAKKAETRSKYIGKAIDKLTKEETEVSEASMSDTEMKKREDIVKGMKKNAQSFKDRYGDRWKSVMYATATKAAMKEGMDPVGKEDSDINNDGKVNASDKYLHRRRKAIAANVKEEVEQLDELSPNTLHSYIKKAAPDVAARTISAVAPNQSSQTKKHASKLGNRIKGITGASGRLADKANMAEESEQIDEAFRAGSIKLHDGSSVTLTKESADVLNNLFNQLNSSNKVKMEDRLMSGSKGFDEILAFAKEV